MRQARLALAFYGQYLKTLLAFRWDFFLNVTGSVIGQALNVAMLTAIFSRIPHLAGWQFDEVLFIYGFAQLPLNLFYLFGSSLLGLHHLILDGHLDQILTRPVNPLVQVLARELGYQQISTLVTSLLILGYAASKLALVWSWWTPFAFAACVAGGFLVYLGMALAVGSLSFWYADRAGLIWLLVTGADFAQYPVTIYDRPMRLLLTWVLPFAFTAFYPATLSLGIREFLPHAWATPLVGMACFAIGYGVWQRGLRNYASTGT